MRIVQSLSMLLFTILSSTSAFAIVDMKNANYANSWVDIEIPGSGYDLKVSRTYNSRSLMNGMFGFGWCSDFETKLDITAEGNLKLTECGAGQETYFTPREFSRKDIDKTISEITNRLRAAKKMDDKAIKTLSTEMISNHDLRARYAMDLKVAIPIRDGSTFYANGKEVDTIIYSKSLYTRAMPDGSSERFSQQGRLTHLYDKNGNYIKFEYDKDNTIREVADNNGRKLTFKYYNNKKVKSVSGLNNLSVEYKYANLDDLSWVKNGWGNVYTYEYDDLHNLTRANYPDNTSIALVYDKKRDWVTSFTDREKCVENYTYEFDEKNPRHHYWSLVKKTCNKEVVNESRHEFWFKERKDGQVYLEKVASTMNGNTTEVMYHESFGKPIAINREGVRYLFDYYPNGQVKTKSAPSTKLSFEYDKASNKVGTVIAAIFNDKGKQIAAKKTQFKYDNKGNLVWAANSDGQQINMTYDTKGRIATIVDHAKKLVKIQYEERFGRPATVTRPGLGTMKVTYKSNGEIDKVNSPEGPTVATQVANTFNNLLEIIQPATAEIYN